MAACSKVLDLLRAARLRAEAPLTRKQHHTATRHGKQQPHSSGHAVEEQGASADDHREPSDWEIDWPSSDESTTGEEIPADEQIPAVELIPADEQIPAVELIPADKQIPAVELIPADEQIPAVEQIPADEQIPAVEQIPADEEVLVEDKLPASETIPVNREKQFLCDEWRSDGEHIALGSGKLGPQYTPTDRAVSEPIPVDMPPQRSESTAVERKPASEAATAVAQSHSKHVAFIACIDGKQQGRPPKLQRRESINQTKRKRNKRQHVVGDRTGLQP